MHRRKSVAFHFLKQIPLWKSGSEELNLNPAQVQQLPAEPSGTLPSESQEQSANESQYQELVTFHQSQEALDTNTIVLASKGVTPVLRSGSNLVLAVPLD